MASTRPYRLCGSTELGASSDRVVASLCAWADAWLGIGAGAPADVEVAVAGGPGLATAAGDWRQATGACGTAWLPSTLSSPLERLLFASTGARSGMSTGLVDEALDALATALAGGGRCHRAVSPPDHLGGPGRAVVQVQAGWGGHCLGLLLELPDAPPPGRQAPHASLGSVALAVGSQPVAVDATLGGVEIDLETLHLLRVGDVLRLDKRVDQGVELAVQGELLRCGGYLVAVDGSVAVELTRAPAI